MTSWAKGIAVRGKLIVSSPEVMAGQPVVAGTRLTVDNLLESLASGETIDQILEAHPELSIEGIQAALQFAAESVRATSPLPKSALLDIYGPHPLTGDEEAAFAIRAFVPGAHSVAVQRQESTTGDPGLEDHRLESSPIRICACRQRRSIPQKISAAFTPGSART